MKAGEDGEEEGVLAASLTSHAQRVLWLRFPKKRLHANLCLLIRTIRRSESIQVWLKARRKRKRKEKILLNCKRSCRNLSFWDVQMSVRAFKMNWQKISSMVLKWTQAFTLRSVNGSQRHSKGLWSLPWKLWFSPCRCGPKEEAVSGDRDERQSQRSSVSGKEDTNLPHDVIEK